MSQPADSGAAPSGGALSGAPSGGEGAPSPSPSGNGVSPFPSSARFGSPAGTPGRGLTPGSGSRRGTPAVTPGGTWRSLHRSCVPSLEQTFSVFDKCKETHACTIVCAFCA